MDYDDAQIPIADFINRRQISTYSHGLYTHDDGSYAFIRIEIGKVWAQGVTFSTIGRDLHAEYVALYPNPSERSTTIGDVSDQLTFEAYVLSQALYLSNPIEIGSYADLVGGPYHYGWHFNWRGDEATIATHTISMSGDFHVLGYWFYRYQFKITEDALGDLTAVVTLEEEVFGQPKTEELVIWYPQYLTFNMGATGPNTCGFLYVDDTYGTTSYKVPVYSYYNADGTLAVVYFFKTVGDGTTWEEAQQQVLDSTCTHDIAINHPGYTGAEDQGLCSIDEFGFEINGVKYSVIDNNLGGFYRKKDCTIALNGGVSENNSSVGGAAQISVYTRLDYIIDDSGSNCIYSGCIYDLECMNIDYTRITYTYGGPGVPARSGKTALILPYNSCESVIIAKYQREREEMNTWNSHGETFMNIQQVARSPAGAPVGDMGKCGWYYPEGGCGYADVDKTQYFVTGGSGCNSQHTVTTSSEVLRDEYLISRYVVTPFESTKTEEYTRNVGDGLGVYTPVFNPPICTGGAEINFQSNNGSAFGHSVRSEFQDTPFYGSNCNITVDDVSPNGFWVGWS